MMDNDEIRVVVSAVLSEQHDNLKAAVEQAVAAALVSFGIHEDERQELRADFQHLRKWRKSVESAQSLTFRAIVGTLAAGGLGALWLGFKTILGK